MPSRAGNHRTRIINLFLPLAAAILLVLAYPYLDTGEREFRQSARFDENAAAFLIGNPGVQGTKQHELGDILFAFGAGSADLPDDQSERVFVLEGMAHLQSPGSSGHLRSTGAFLNTAYLLGLEKGNRPAAVFELEPGSALPLAKLYDTLRARYSGKIAVLGIGMFESISSRPGENEPVPESAVFYGLPDPGRMWGEGDRILQTEALLIEDYPRLGRSPEPDEVLAAADAARPSGMTRVYPQSTLTKAVVLVYLIQDFYLFEGYIDPPLVDVTVLDPSIVADIRYAGTNNFTGIKIYESPQAYLALPVAERLVRVSSRLQEQGFRLKVWDAYRPASAQELLWEAATDKRFVAPPNKGSRHSRAAAVDVTLITSDGREVEMPTGFDEFSIRAHRSYQGGTPESRHHRDLLQEAMMAEGFLPLAHEWWHFESPDWANYPILDIPVRDDGN